MPGSGPVLAAAGLTNQRTAISRDADVERRERELLARFRLRLARTASRVALIVIAAIGVGTLVEPMRGAAALALLWTLLAVAAIVSLAIHDRSRPGAEPLPLWAFYLWTAGVLAFDSAVVFLYGDPTSDIYLAYLLPVLFAAATLPASGAALALAGSVLAYLVIIFTLDGEMAGDEVVLRAATFAVVGLLGGYLAREQQREIGIRADQERHLSELLGKVISAQEDERKRIARELHDGPLQALSMVSMQLGHVEEMGAEDFAKSQSRIAELRAALRRTLRDVRLMIQDLRPSALDDLGLVSALREFAEARCDAAGVRLDWDIAGRPHHLPPPVETAVFRIVQEGVNNVVRHAHARKARVALRFEDGHLYASVEDDGVGFDPEQRRRSMDGRHVGLLGMEERTTLVGGTLEIESAPAHGTTVRAAIPLGGTHDG